MRTGIIYLHRNIKNDKCYVGSTVQDPRRRWRKRDKSYHSYRTCPVFYKALNKYGWKGFKTAVLEEDIPIENLHLREEYYINKHNCVAPNGYNTVEIVKGSVVFSEDTKKRLSEARKKYLSNLEEPLIAWNKKDHIMIDGKEHKECARCKQVLPIEVFCSDKSNWDNKARYCTPCGVDYKKRYNKYLSKEEWEDSYKKRTLKMRQSIIDNYKNNPDIKKKISEARKKPLRATHKDTGQVISFESGLEAKEKGYHSPNIGKAMSLNKPYKGYYWEYVDSSSDDGDYLIFDYERSDSVKSAIWDSIKNPNKSVIYARKCSIKQPSKAECKSFMELNHLQGSVNAKVVYGLYYEEVLVAAMSFGKPRYKKDHEWELLRFCNKLNIRVVGGASKLLKKFIEDTEAKSIISYANRRFSKGDLYEKIGFKYVRTNSKGYSYSKNGKVYHRSAFMKHRLKNVLETFDPALTEKQNMLNNGYEILVDRGTLVYSWKA